MKKVFCAVLVMALSICVAAYSYAGTAKELDASVDNALKNFENVKGSSALIKNAAGVLVFPSVIKAGIGFGGEFGEGALRIKGKTVDYYNTIAGSFGFQLGAQVKTIILVFNQKEALATFQNASGWKVGVDASVAVVTVGAGGAIDTSTINEPIVAFIFDQKGLMYNLTLEGAKMTKIRKN